MTRPGPLGADARPSERIVAQIGYTRRTSVPTAGAIVESGLDDCNICEPVVGTLHRLKVERMQLPNKLRARQIEPPDKSQEYRCGPVGEAETPA